MLNINSPTVQAMLNNTPQGVGNMPVYSGNTPQISTQQFQTPYPSPKDMVIQGGLQNVYSPTYFTPTNPIVGAYNPMYGSYNPAVQAAFSGYNNPYMGYNMGAQYNPYGYNPYLAFANPYGYQYNNGQPFVPQSAEDCTIDSLNNLMSYGIIPVAQIQKQKELSDNALKSVLDNNISHEVSDSHSDSMFSYYCDRKTELDNPRDFEIVPPPRSYSIPKILKSQMEVTISDGAGSEKDITTMPVDYSINMGNREVSNAYMWALINRYNQERFRQIVCNLYNTSPARKYDDVSMIEYFNNGSKEVLAHDFRIQQMEMAKSYISQTYNSDAFRRILENNGLSSKEHNQAVMSYVGRYGYMPNGRPVFPGHDPSISESFSYNPATGQYTVSPPSYMQKRLDEAKANFLKTLQNG